MELGITPVVTSGLVMQLLAGSKIIEVGNNVCNDRAFLNGAQKLLDILIAVGEAVAYVVMSSQDCMEVLINLVSENAILIILQLFFAGIIVKGIIVKMSSFRRVMVLVLGFPYLLRPISVKTLSRKHSAQQLSTVAVELSLKELSSRCSICS